MVNFEQVNAGKRYLRAGSSGIFIVNTERNSHLF